MAQQTLARKTTGQPGISLIALLLLDAFVLGGLFMLKLVDQLLQTIMGRMLTIEGWQEIFNVWDHLAPYWFGYIVISLLLACITVAAFVWRRVRRDVVAR